MERESVWRYATETRYNYSQYFTPTTPISFPERFGDVIVCTHFEKG